MEEREQIGLAFVAAMQLLPPKQRVTVVLRDVLDWSAREVAELLEDTVPAVNSALQRGRDRLQRERDERSLARAHAPANAAEEERVMRRFQEAWAAVDFDGIVSLLTDDALLRCLPRHNASKAAPRSAASLPPPHSTVVSTGSSSSQHAPTVSRRSPPTPTNKATALRSVRRDGVRRSRRLDRRHHGVRSAAGALHPPRPPDPAGRGRGPRIEGDVAYDEILADRVRDVLAGEPGLSERKMFGGLAFMLDGHMCCGLVGDRLMLRLGADEAARALRRPHVEAMDLTGRPMTGMVHVTADRVRGRALGRGEGDRLRADTPSEAAREAGASSPMMFEVGSERQRQPVCMDSRISLSRASPSVRAPHRAAHHRRCEPGEARGLASVS